MDAMEKYSLDEIKGLETLLRDMPPYYDVTFNLLRLNSATEVMGDAQAMKTAKELLDAGWLPFMGFWFKAGWGRIIFHDCEGWVRPYVVGYDRSFVGCKRCERQMPAEVWAAQQLLNGGCEEQSGK
jgi:hypothetical protein